MAAGQNPTTIVELLACTSGAYKSTLIFNLPTRGHGEGSKLSCSKGICDGAPDQLHDSIFCSPNFHFCMLHFCYLKHSRLQNLLALWLNFELQNH